MANTHAKQRRTLNADRYRGQWVALDPKTDEVVGHNASLDAAENEAIRRGIDGPVMEFVPKSDGYFVGGV